MPPTVIINGVTYAPTNCNFYDAVSLVNSGTSKVDSIKKLRKHYDWSLKRSKLFYEILMDDEWERIELLNKDLFAQVENLERLVKQKETRINELDRKLEGVKDALNYDEYKEDMNYNEKHDHDEWDSSDCCNRD